jgi:hypothetical protein
MSTYGKQRKYDGLKPEQLQRKRTQESPERRKSSAAVFMPLYIIAYFKNPFGYTNIHTRRFSSNHPRI